MTKTRLGPKLRLLMVMPRFVRRRVMLSRYRNEIAASGEKELLAVSSMLPADGGVALDVGANLGTYTYALAEAGARVVACEPNPDLASLLRSLNIPGVEVVECAASDADGEAQLAMPQMRSGHVLASLSHDVLDKTGAENDLITVKTRRLDDLVKDRVDFIKIDVEGHEEQTLDGAHGIIAKYDPVLLIEIEERHNAGAVARVQSRLRKLGYSMFFLHAGRWKPGAEFEAAVHQNYDRAFGGIRPSPRVMDYVANFLFLPKARRIDDVITPRIQAA